MAALTGATMLAKVEFVNPFHQLVKIRLLVKHEAGFKISSINMLCAHARTGQIGRADKGQPAVHHNGLGMHPWAENAFKQVTLYQRIKPVEVFSESRARFFGVNESDSHAVFNQVAKHLQQWLEPVVDVHVQIFDVGCHYPEETLSRWQMLLNELRVDIPIKQKLVHGRSVTPGTTSLGGGHSCARAALCNTRSIVG